MRNLRIYLVIQLIDSILNHLSDFRAIQRIFSNWIQRHTFHQ